MNDFDEALHNHMEAARRLGAAIDALVAEARASFAPYRCKRCGLTSTNPAELCEVEAVN
jgi:hypothetical protein